MINFIRAVYTIKGVVTITLQSFILSVKASIKLEPISHHPQTTYGRTNIICQPTPRSPH